MSKVRDQVEAKRAEVETEEQTSAPDVSAQLTAMAKQIADLQRQLIEQRQQQAVAGPTQPSAPPDERYAVGKPGEGKKLFGVSLPGHKSRVMDPDRQAPVYLDVLPIWATNKGEAWDIFSQVYHQGLSTKHTPKIEVLRDPEQSEAA